MRSSRFILCKIWFYGSFMKMNEESYLDLSLTKVAKRCNHLDLSLVKIRKGCNHHAFSLAKVARSCNHLKASLAKSRKCHSFFFCNCDYTVAQNLQNSDFSIESDDSKLRFQHGIFIQSSRFIAYKNGFLLGIKIMKFISK